MAAAVGDLVEYHGTFKRSHGLYRVVDVPADPDGRGYALRRVDDGTRIENVSASSITKVPDTKGRPAMQPGMKTLNDYPVLQDENVERTEFDPDSWTEMIPLLLWAVRKGLLDPHLYAIGEAMRSRYLVLYPEQAPALPNNGLNPWYTDPSQVASLSLLGVDELVPSTPRGGVGTVPVGQKHYAKTALVSKMFRMPPNTMEDKGLQKHLNGLVVQIVSVGRTKLSVRAVEQPSWATEPGFIHALKTETFSVDISDVDFILGD